jgi:hypothetical protein
MLTAQKSVRTGKELAKFWGPPSGLKKSASRLTDWFYDSFFGAAQETIALLLLN